MVRIILSARFPILKCLLSQGKDTGQVLPGSKWPQRLELDIRRRGRGSKLVLFHTFLGSSPVYAEGNQKKKGNYRIGLWVVKNNVLVAETIILRKLLFRIKRLLYFH